MDIFLYFDYIQDGSMAVAVSLFLKIVGNCEQIKIILNPKSLKLR